MSFFETTLSMLIDQKMKYMGERQSVLAQNVANVDTPHYKAQDLKAPDFKKMLNEHTSKLPVVRTNPAI
jgi:flagellar basal-body rod protein FlgB